MSAMSDYLENEILDHILSTGAFTMPSNVYVGLSTGSFGDDNSGTELTGNNYSRVSASFSAASGGTTSNSGAIEFAAASGRCGSTNVSLHWYSAAAEPAAGPRRRAPTTREGSTTS